MINVDWYDAIEYCNWRSQHEGLQPVYTIDKSRKDPNNSSKYDDKKWLVTASWTANGYRLPLETEWEYAAREGGKKVRFGNGLDVAAPQHINFDGSESFEKSFSMAGVNRMQTVETGSLPANGLGLYEMSGNVREWCWDWYTSDYYGQKNNGQEPKGPASGEYRVVRGGSWGDNPDYCRAALRNRSSSDNRSYSLGFRLVRR